MTHLIHMICIGVMIADIWVIITVLNEWKRRGK